MSKTLLITASTFPRWEGDTEPRFILDYAKAMTKYYKVLVLVPMAPGAASYEELEGVSVLRYRYFPIKSLETLCYPGAIVPRIKEKKLRVLLVPFLLFGLWRSLKKLTKKVDIVHAHWLIPQGLIQSGFKNVPYILTGHGGDVTSLNFEPVSSMKKKAMKRAGAITVVSKALKEYTDRFYPNDKTSIIPMGCDTHAFSPNSRREDFYKQNGKKAILFVGRLAEKKGVTYLIEAMKAIDGAVLYIAGKGNLEESLKKQAVGLGEQVVFLGPKTHSELPQIYASADVFVAPSVTAADGDKEGFGLVIIEAMASGVPVVASNSGGIPDIITDGENGLLCEEKNPSALAGAINRVLSDEGLREKLIKNGYDTAESYSYERIAERYHKIIEDVLNSHNN